ncbi:monofunctional biosynthetic peptidoglycan transglycosylase [Mesorhizobium sp. NBSH29]|uniref:monofunctional biosynthetic peptidoglycan transglycosylase n=1 Tax=Mesorhizobium sp. NBSH29 TaxID=2654249 RepID=UPI0018964636|nr:monofunctional biosynthetic peptidoglycan transglycosylase [Mesorhizobium sp. NBSH29]
MPPKRKREPSRNRLGVRPRTWLRRGLLLCGALAMVPALLTLLYWPAFVHPISTLMLQDLVSGRGYDRRWVPIDEVAPHLLHSIIMSEDGQFCSHKGIDFAELNLVIDDAMSGEGTRGASTIPMQTVKNLYLWGGRSIIRKILEAPLALYLDTVLTKRRIMEIYVNIVEWGPGIYGAEAASQHHFGRPAKDLTFGQAALLAVSLPNPIARDPARPGPGLRRLATLIEKRARKSGYYVGCVN